jgi:hypothetical protein
MTIFEYILGIFGLLAVLGLALEGFPLFGRNGEIGRARPAVGCALNQF